jgi:pyruvate/2-oxoglutarate dehydrogenase complex dihydrolipoamide dehydrogenase (E3) component
MSQPEMFDVVILGSGQGGKRLAWLLGSQGKKVAVVERSWVGGSCPAVACLPSKNEIYGARIAHLVRRAAHYGILTESVRTDMAGVWLRKTEMVEKEVQLHLNNYQKAGVELIMGSGRFTGARTIEVRLNGDGGLRTVAGNEIVINVGTSAMRPDIKGLPEANPLTHIELLELDRVPAHLIVLGGGYIGVEIAQAYRRFGSRVTIIEPASQILSREDSDIAEEISRLMTTEQVDVLTNSQPVRVDGRNGQSVSVTIQTKSGKQKVEGSHLLVASGRVANTNDIGLEKTNVALTSSGFIKVDERLQTTASGVWAIGECAGSPQFTHVSVDDFRIVRENMMGGDRKVSGRLIPQVLFTDPPFARVGLSETEARARNIPFRIAKIPMSKVLRTFATDETDGFLKVLVGERDDNILGFAMIGSEAGEVMTVIQTAMLAGLPYPKLRDAIIAHLTMAEGLGSLFEALPTAVSA